MPAGGRGAPRAAAPAALPREGPARAAARHRRGAHRARAGCAGAGGPAAGALLAPGTRRSSPWGSSRWSWAPSARGSCDPKRLGEHPDVDRDRAAEDAAPDRSPIRGNAGPPSRVLSPDGRRIVFQQDDWLWLHDLADTEPSRIPGTEDVGRFLAWSPDAGSIAFERSGHLETLRLGESRGERRCAWPGRFGTCSWGDDDAFLVEFGGLSQGVFYLAPGADELVRLDWLDPGILTTHAPLPPLVPAGRGSVPDHRSERRRVLDPGRLAVGAHDEAAAAERQPCGVCRARATSPGSTADVSTSSRSTPRRARSWDHRVSWRET